jgi:hypothetical protein
MVLKKESRKLQDVVEVLPILPQQELLGTSLSVQSYAVGKWEGFSFAVSCPKAVEPQQVPKRCRGNRSQCYWQDGALHCILFWILPKRTA